jgi:hypothetical protein
MRASLTTVRVEASGLPLPAIAADEMHLVAERSDKAAPRDYGATAAGG